MENLTAVKDFTELGVYNVVNGEHRDELGEKIEQEYLNDSDQVLCLTFVIDHSNSIKMANVVNIVENILGDTKEIMSANPEAVAKIRISIIVYGTNFEILNQWITVNEMPIFVEYKPMGNTSTSLALDKAFEITKAEMKYQGNVLRKGVKPGMVIHVTDGVPVEPNAAEKLEKVIDKYDAYSDSKGMRKIRLYSIGIDSKSCKLLEGYSDIAYECTDYTGIKDGINHIVNVASILSSTDSHINFATNEIHEDIPDDMPIPDVGDGVIEIKKRKKMPFKQFLGLD